MKLDCSTEIINRRAAALNMTAKKRHKRSLLALMKKPGTAGYSILHVTPQNSLQYSIKNNIQKIFTKFMNEGKATIVFKQPEHDVLIVAEHNKLKQFLIIVRKILTSNESEIEIPGACTVSTTLTIQCQPSTKLVINSKQQYPVVEGFSASLTLLVINNIKLETFDSRILRLHSLQILNLNNNSLKIVPKELGLLKLCELHLSQNLLSYAKRDSWSWLDGTIRDTLHTLDLSKNQLNYLPEALNQCIKLSTLNVESNHLSYLHPQICRLPSLRNLNISNNDFLHLPSALKRPNLIKLDKLDYSKNSFLRDKVHVFIQYNIKSYPCTLKELASRIVLAKGLPFSEEDLPKTLIRYLETMQVCKCGKPCIIPYAAVVSIASSGDLANCVISGQPNSAVPLLNYCCSLICSQSYCPQLKIYRCRR